MQKIILCPICRVQVKKDNLGELVCPNCNARLCPKAHIFDGKICKYCGWEDPNYSLWQKAQKERFHRPRSRMQDEQTEIKAQYVCPNCGVNIGSIQNKCPNCGWLGAKSGGGIAAPTGAISVPVKSSATTKAILDSIPREPAIKRADKPDKSSFAKEIAGAEQARWQFPPLKQFVRPVLVSTLMGIIITGLVFGGIYTARFIRQNIKLGASPPSTAVTPGNNHGTGFSLAGAHSAKTYTLNMSIVPEAAGEIIIVPPSSSKGTFESGSHITLTAVPNDCHTFSYWDGVAESSENVTITMDSNKSITANFKPKNSAPPVISEVKATDNSDVSTTITWLTDKSATGQVDYGETKDYGLSAASTEGLTTDHKVRITGLRPSTTYYFSVKSADKCGNVAEEKKMIATAREITNGERVGQRAIDFTLPYYDDNNPESPNKAGKTETLSTYIGKKKILLNFWSTHCGACIGEFPFIRGIYEDKNWANRNSEDADFVVFTVCIDSNLEEAPDRIKILEEKFSQEAGPFTFPILFDTVGQTQKDYHIWTIPETAFIDLDGIIRNIQIGRFKNIEEIENILESLN